MADSWACKECGRGDNKRRIRLNFYSCNYCNPRKPRGKKKKLQLKKESNKRRKQHPSDMRSPIPSSSSSNNNNNNNSSSNSSISQRSAKQKPDNKLQLNKAVESLEHERKILKSLSESNKDIKGYKLKCLVVREFLNHRIKALSMGRLSSETTHKSAKKAGDTFKVCGKTIRTNYSLFKKSRCKGFPADKRGSYKRQSIVDDLPEVSGPLLVWLRWCRKRSLTTGKANTKPKARNWDKFPEISAKNTMNHVNKLFKVQKIKSDWFLKEPDKENEEMFQIKLTTATKLLHDLGYEMTHDKKGYVDNHERPDVVQARNEYVKIKLQDEKLQCLWTDDGVHVDIWSRLLEGEEDGSGKNWCRIRSFGEHGGLIHPEMEEEIPFADRIGHEDQTKRPKKQYMGDETVYVPRSTTKSYWNERGRLNRMPKDNKGRGTMLAGIVSELFGELKVTEAQIKIINDNYNTRYGLPRNTKHLIYGSSYTRFDYGANHDGYWSAEQVLKYHELVLDMHDLLYPGWQAIIDVDQSLNHVCFADDALRANLMNSGWGGKQKKMRSFKHTFTKDDGLTETKTIDMVFKEGDKLRTKFGGKEKRLQPDSHIGQPIGMIELAYRLKLLEPPPPRDESESDESSDESESDEDESSDESSSDEEEEDVLLGDDELDVIQKDKRKKQTQKLVIEIRENLENEIERLTDQQMQWFTTKRKSVHRNFCGCVEDVDGKNEIVRGCGNGGEIFPCYYCNSAWHIGCVRNLSLLNGKPRQQAPDGVYACEECIELACDNLNKPMPKYPTEGWWNVRDTENFYVLRKIAAEAEEEKRKAEEEKQIAMDVEIDDDRIADDDSIADDEEKVDEEKVDEEKVDEEKVDEDEAETEMEEDNDEIVPVEQMKHGSKKWLIYHLSQIPAFKKEMSKLGELVREKGHLLRFIPKYHCEMNCIELYWGRSKMWVRKYTDGSFHWLTSYGIWKSLDEEQITLQLRQKFSRKQREFVRAYSEAGVTSHNVDAKRELFKATHLQRKWILDKIRDPDLRHGGKSSTFVNVFDDD